MKQIFRSILPSPLYAYFRRKYRAIREKRYSRQGAIMVRCGKYQIEAPGSHLLVDIHRSQPLRDLCVGLTAKFFSEKYPDKSIIDIGANIGDTAAIISSFASNPLILVEGSDVFFCYLVRNTKQLPNRTTLHHAVVLDGQSVPGEFHHWGGTASFRVDAGSASKIASVRLRDLGGPSPCFIKTDTDGHDFAILLDSVEWFADARPAVLFENQIRTTSDLEQCNKLLERLWSIGYRHFMVWDDPGYYLLSTSSLDIIKDLNQYLFEIWNNAEFSSRICNYDVLACHAEDEDIFAAMVAYVRSPAWGAGLAPRRSE